MECGYRRRDLITYDAGVYQLSDNFFSRYLA